MPNPFSTPLPAKDGYCVVYGANLRDAAGNQITSAKLLFWPRIASGAAVAPLLPGGNGHVSADAVEVDIDSTGKWQTYLARVDLAGTVPLWFRYAIVAIGSTGRSLLTTGYDSFQPAAAEFDFDTFQPALVGEVEYVRGEPGTPGLPGRDGTNGATTPNFLQPVDAPAYLLPDGSGIVPVLRNRHVLWAAEDAAGMSPTYVTDLGVFVQLAAAMFGKDVEIDGGLTVKGVLQASLGFASGTQLLDLPAGNRLNALDVVLDANGAVASGVRIDGTMMGRNVDVSYMSDPICGDADGNTFYVQPVFRSAFKVDRYEMQIFGNFPQLTPSIRQLTFVGDNNFPAMAADGRTLLFITNRNGTRERYRMSKYGLSQMPAGLGTFLTRYTLVQHVSTGQSLDEGWPLGGIFVARPASPYDLMLTAGTRMGVPVAGLQQIVPGAIAGLVPLQETNVDWLPDGSKPQSAGGETKCSAAAATARTILHNAAVPYRSIWIVSGTIGTPYSGLKQTQFTPPHPDPFSNIVTGVTAAQALAAAAGYRYAVGAAHHMQGENDEQNATANYDTACMLDWNQTLNAALRPITGQPDNFPCIWGQIAPLSLAQFAQHNPTNGNAGGVPDHTAGTADHGMIGDAMLRAAENYPDQILIACPQNIFNDAGDKVHVGVQGQDWNGEYHGKCEAWHRLYLEGKQPKRWTGLRPRAISRQGTEIIIDLYVPVGPVVRDTSYGNAMPNTVDQFSATDALGNAIAVTSVSLMNGSALKVTVASDPGPGQLYIEHAWRIRADAPAGAYPSFYHDSDATPSLYGSVAYLFNYLLSFRKAC